MKFKALQHKRQLVRHKNIIGIEPRVFRARPNPAFAHRLERREGGVQRLFSLCACVPAGARASQVTIQHEMFNIGAAFEIVILYRCPKILYDQEILLIFLYRTLLIQSQGLGLMQHIRNHKQSTPIFLLTLHQAKLHCIHCRS